MRIFHCFFPISVVLMANNRIYHNYRICLLLRLTISVHLTNWPINRSLVWINNWQISHFTNQPVCRSPFDTIPCLISDISSLLEVCPCIVIELEHREPVIDNVSNGDGKKNSDQPPTDRLIGQMINSTINYSIG